jgi:RHS repeat-associated protein
VNGQTQVTRSNGSSTYSYDASGRRVKKVTPQATTVYVYDAFSQLIAEYTSVTHTAPPCTTCYITQDHLGSTRLVTDQYANIVARHDYLPFGEEIYGGIAGRDNWYNSSAGTNQKFTGQEHDPESNFDFFQARYFNAGQGRFLSPDPMNAGADPFNPQSWNAYPYVKNNPLILIDPTGLADEESRPTFSVTGTLCKWWQFWCGGGSSGGSLNIGWIPSQGDAGYYPPSDPAPLPPTRTKPEGPTIGPAKKVTDSPFVPKNSAAFDRCINSLLAQAVARGIGSFFAPPSDPAWTDLASIVKGAAQSPALKVATVYVAGEIAQRLLTKLVASRWPPKWGVSSYLLLAKPPPHIRSATQCGKASAGTRTN